MKNYFLAAVLLLLFSCQEKETVLPIPEFSLSDSFGHNAEIFAAGEMVRVDSVSKADSYLWDFGDGEISREATPAHTYKEPGTYTLKLTIKSGNAERVVGKEIKVGTYYAEELLLLNYAESFWVDESNKSASSVKNPTNLYFTINERYPLPITNPLIFTSETFKDVKKEDLPRSFKIPDLRMDSRGFNYSIDFFANGENGEEGNVASTYHTTSSAVYYYPEKNERYIRVGRGATPGNGFLMHIKFKRKLFN